LHKSKTRGWLISRLTDATANPLIGLARLYDARHGTVRWKIGGCSPRCEVQSIVSNKAGANPMQDSIRVLTAQKVFAWTFDFEFLMQKADHDLYLSMTEGSNFFFSNAMNFSVTIHAISDYLWHVKEFHDPKWANDQNNFLHWVTTQNDCIAVFVDLSNTYKHSDRYKPNAFAERLGLYPDDSVQHSPSPEDLKNRIVHSGPSGDVFLWPVLTKPDGRLIYYHYAAVTALVDQI
jgi:hypothetical protein